MLSLSWGLGFIERQDLIFSPFIHSDITFANLGLEYTREARLFQNVQFRYAGFNPMVSNPYDFTVHGEPEHAYPHTFTMVDLDYMMGKQIKQINKYTFTAGGLFNADVQAMNYVYGRISSLGYYAAFGLGVFGKTDYALNKKSKLSAVLKLPLVVWLARSPYLVNDDQFIENISSHSGFNSFMAFIQDGKLATWNRVQTFDVQLKYTYSLSSKWELGAAYLFEFIHSSRPRNLLSYRNSLYISGNFRF